MAVAAHPMTRKRIVLAPRVESSIQRTAFQYRGAANVPLDATIYRPAVPPAGGHLPAVILVSGYPDPAFESRFGCAQAEMGSYVSWAELLAASGMAAVTYRNVRPEDAAALLRRVRDGARSLGIDRDRIALWSCSGNVPNALSMLMEATPSVPVCAALCYGFLLDLDGHTAVADAASTWGFANPTAGSAIADLPKVPLLVVRAGADAIPGLNASLDRFVSAAVAADRDLTLVNVGGAPHAFDVELDSAESRAAIQQIVAFLATHLDA